MSTTRFTKSGFTLIELLVVIAIIGILASVILASLNSARSRGVNATIKSQLNAIRTQAALYYDTNGNYGPAKTCKVSSDGSIGDCTQVTGDLISDPTVFKLLLSIAEKNRRTDGYGGFARINIAVGASPGYAAYAYLKANENGNAVWCVDSTGVSKYVATHWSNTATACP